MGLGKAKDRATCVFYYPKAVIYGVPLVTPPYEPGTVCAMLLLLYFLQRGQDLIRCGRNLLNKYTRGVMDGIGYGCQDTGPP